MKTRFFLLNLFLTITLSTIAQRYNDWQWINPKPQGNTLNSVYFSDSSHGIAVGEMATILKTNDGGNTWKLIQIDSTLIDNNFIDVSMVDSLNAYILEDYANVFRTYDGGETWSKLVSPFAFPETVNSELFFTGLDTGYVVGDVNIQSTTDGEKFKAYLPYNPPYSLPSVKAIDFINKDTGICVGVYSNSNAQPTGQVFRRTFNGGKTWEVVYQNNTYVNNLYDVDFVNKNYIYVAGAISIYKSTDCGNSWQEISTSATSTFKYLDTLNAIKCDMGGYLYSTSNGGKNWTAINSIVNYNSGMKKIFFLNQKYGFAVGYNGIISKTLDGGKNWVTITGFPLTTKVSASGNTIYTIKSLNKDTAFIALSSSAIFKTINGGKTWLQKQSTSTFVPIKAFTFPTDKIGYAVGGSTSFDGLILKTTDGGETWKSIKYSSNDRSYTDVYFVNKDTGIVIGLQGTIFSTTDGGVTWNKPTPFNSSSSETFNKICFIDNKKGYVGCNSGYLFTTNNGGVSWAKINSNLTNTFRSLFFLDSINVYGFGPSGMIYKTTDGGLTWTTKKFTYVSDLNDIWFKDYNNGYIVGENGYIIKTIDGGVSWNKLYSPKSTVKSIKSIGIVDNEFTYITGDQFTILKYTPTDIITKINDKVNESRETIGLNIYPNPASRLLNISFTKNINEIEIYSLLGQKVYSKKIKSSNIIENIDLLELSNGVYFVKVYSDNSILIKKFIKQ